MEWGIIGRKWDKLLNAFGAATALFLFYFGPIIGTIISVFLLFSPLCPLLVIYFVWIYADRQTPYRDGRRSNWIRSLQMHQRFRDYFPQKIVKTAELPSNENYMLCVFPHGILCTGAFSQFTSENLEFTKLFPGISVSCHTLNTNFYFPFSREYALAIGLHSVSKEAIVYQLSKPVKGHAVCLVVGGSAEAMISSPGTHRVILKKRKGFVKLALTTGTNLVPVYLFGETDLYKHYIFPQNSLVYKFQEAFRKYTGVAPVLVRGSGIIQGVFGLLPYSHPVHMVVGKPIKVEKNEKPSMEDINKLHVTFMEELTNLFEEQKHNFVMNPEITHLSIEE